MITGAVHSGKTALARDTVDILKSKDVTVCGILSVAVLEDGSHLGYDGVDIKSGERFPLLRDTPGDISLKTNGFYFIPEGLERACGIIEESKANDVVVIDELGPAEISGKRGLWPSAQKVFSEGRNALVVVRGGLLEKFLSLDVQTEVKVYTVGSESAGEIALDVESGSIESGSV